MKWRDTVPDIRSRDVRALTKQMSIIDAVAFLFHTEELPVVVFDENARESIAKHLSTRSVELGGLLTGHVYSKVDLQDGIVAIHVSRSVACEEFSSTGTSLSMNSDVWQKANSSVFDEAFVVGWYHSHPNLGAFFSGTDRRTQKDFFKNDYSLGLVVDPIRNDSKWFLGPDCIELPPSRILGAESGLEMA